MRGLTQYVVVGKRKLYCAYYENWIPAKTLLAELNPLHKYC